MVRVCESNIIFPSACHDISNISIEHEDSEMVCHRLHNLISASNGHEKTLSEDGDRKMDRQMDGQTDGRNTICPFHHSSNGGDKLHGGTSNEYPPFFK